MILSYYSFVMAVIWGNIFVGTIFLFRRYRNNFSFYVLFYLLLFCILRVLIPVELPYTYTVNSVKILPVVQSFLNYTLFRVNFRAVPVYSVILFIWLGTAAVTIVVHILRYYHLKRALALLPETEDCRLYRILSEIGAYRQNNQGLRKVFSRKLLPPDIKIAVHPAVKSPSIVGIRKPVIVLPHTDFTDEELHYIFFHEYMHYQYGHVFIKLLTGGLQAFLWWSPLIKRFFCEISYALEMHSDQKVCNVLDREQKAEYLQTILNVLKDSGTHRKPAVTTCNMVEPGDSDRMEQRFHMILNKNYCKKRNRDRFAVVGLLFVFLFSYAFVFQPYSEPVEEDYEEGIIDGTILPGTYIVEEGGRFNIYSPKHEYIGFLYSVEWSDEEKEEYGKLKIYTEEEGRRLNLIDNRQDTE